MSYGVTSDNQYKGGITFNAPAFQLGAYNGASVNGGFNFDLPLATVASFTNKALDFSAANSNNNRGFLGGVINTAQQQVTKSSNSALEFLSSTNKTLAEMQTNNGFNANYQALLGSQKKSGGGCFITTAICEDSGLPDDCDTLKTLRNFRDGYMLRHFELEGLVQKYYAIAPDIVEKIKAMENAREIFAILRTEYIEPAVTFIKAGMNTTALLIYSAMVTRAQSLAEGK